ncbi:hypothetical protein [Halomonas sp. G11]|uniref:hypothetical protein n=1 Tax=Halomonas sp. G11 TaxID=1684425 RepID=UPI0007FE4005|nr:hypothetical protein [Halomonas sp. G11]OAZ99750.1 hypothetical protein ADS46_13170 [Halomonas sp. G11]
MMKVFWFPIIATVIIWAIGGGFYWEIREGTHYQLSDAERVNAYLTIFAVASALTGSIFLIFQHWFMRLQLAQTNKPRLYLAVVHNTLNNDPQNPHRTSLKYTNLTDNDFEDLEIFLYGSVDKNETQQFLQTCKKRGYVQGRDERVINIFTNEIIDNLSKKNNNTMNERRSFRIQAKYEFTYLRKKITHYSPVYIFNFSSNTWDIDE